MPKVWNFGSLNLDFVYRMPHFVRAGETLASDRLSVFCGGKGLNQSVALARAGSEVIHVGQVGEDGDPLCQMLSENGVSLDFLKTVPGKTGHAIIQVEDAGQNAILLFGGANRTVPADLFEAALSQMAPGDWLICQNEMNDMPLLLSMAKKRGVSVAFNPSPIDSTVTLEGVTLLFINEIEGEALTGESDPAAICEALLRKHPDLRVVLTLGGNGVRYQDANAVHTHGIFPVTPVDTTAAGDTFSGFFLSALLRGEEVPTALKQASMASAIAVSRPGAAPSIPTLAQVLDALKNL